MERLLVGGSLVEHFGPGGFVVDGGDEGEDRRGVQLQARGLVFQEVVGLLVDPALQRLVHLLRAGLPGEGIRVVLFGKGLEGLLIILEGLVHPQGVGEEARAFPVVLIVGDEQVLHPFAERGDALFAQQVEELLTAVAVRGLREHGERQVHVDGGVERVLAGVAPGRLARSEDLGKGLFVEGLHRLRVAFAGFDPFVVVRLVRLIILVRGAFARCLDRFRVDRLRDGEVRGRVRRRAGDQRRHEDAAHENDRQHGRQVFQDPFHKKSLLGSCSKALVSKSVIAEFPEKSKFRDNRKHRAAREEPSGVCRFVGDVRQALMAAMMMSAICLWP